MRTTTRRTDKVATDPQRRGQMLFSFVLRTMAEGREFQGTPRSHTRGAYAFLSPRARFRQTGDTG